MKFMDKTKISRALRSRITGAWWWGYTRFPAIVPEFNRRGWPPRTEQDRTANAQTTVPKDESVDLLCFLALEVYGPAEIDQLYAGLRKLGWDNSWRVGLRENCIEWIQRQRQRGHAGSCTVGIVNGMGRGGLSPDGLQADLPDGIEYLIVKVHHICPSLTGIQILFAVDAKFRGEYQTELNTERTSERKPVKGVVGAYTHLDPFSQKTRSIQSIRANWQRRISDWMWKYLPGLFCSTANRGIPTAECVMTNAVNIVDGSKEMAGPSRLWCDVLTSRVPYDVWKYAKNDAIYIAPIGYERDERSHLFVAICQERIPTEMAKKFGGADIAGVTSILWETLDRVPVQFGVLAVLTALRCRLMLVRDAQQRMRSGERRAIKALDDIQKFFASDAQVPGILLDLKVAAEECGNLLWWGSGFVPVKVNPNEAPPDLSSRIREIVRATADSLIRNDEVTRDGLKQLSDVVSARVSVRAQRTMRRLTWWVIFLSMVTAIETVALSKSGNELVSWVRDIYERIGGVL